MASDETTDHVRFGWLNGVCQNLYELLRIFDLSMDREPIYRGAVNFRTTKHRPPGVSIIGYLTVFAAIGRLCSPHDRPFLAFGVLLYGLRARVLRLSIALLGIYLGVGILKCFRHIWYVYILVACIGIINIALMLAHESAMWELSLVLQMNMEVIPRFIRVVQAMHIALAIIYAYAAWYIYTQRETFWGNTDV